MTSWSSVVMTGFAVSERMKCIHQTSSYENQDNGVVLGDQARLMGEGGIVYASVLMCSPDSE